MSTCEGSAGDTVGRYIEAVWKILTSVVESQRDRIVQVSKTVARAVAAGGAAHLLDNGHLLGSELISRAGGLALLRAVTVDDVKEPTRVRRGDVLFIASVSGRSASVVDAALLAKERGVFTVALTSSAQAGVAVPQHPSGALLRDVAAVTLDIGGVGGDALLDFPGMEQRACPSSGVVSAALMWTIVAETIKEIISLGILPTVFTSVNVADGERRYDEELVRYRRLGF